MPGPQEQDRHASTSGQSVTSDRPVCQVGSVSYLSDGVNGRSIDELSSQPLIADVTVVLLGKAEF